MSRIKTSAIVWSEIVKRQNEEKNLCNDINNNEDSNFIKKSSDNKLGND